MSATLTTVFTCDYLEQLSGKLGCENLTKENSSLSTAERVGLIVDGINDVIVQICKSNTPVIPFIFNKADNRSKF